MDKPVDKKFGHKVGLIWFIDSKGMRDYEVLAKCKQLVDYVNGTKFFNKFNVMIIPSKENKFQILESDEVLNDSEYSKFRNDQKELDNWLATIKNKLRDCLTVYL